MKKKLIIPISLISFIAVVAIIYVSYGFVSARITNNELAKKQTFMNQKLEIEYSDGTETLTSNNTSFIPGSTITKTFTVKNTGNVKLNFKINLENVTNTFSRKDDITYELYLGEKKLISGIYPSTNTTIAYNQTINKNVSKNYTLKIIYNTSNENQIADSGATINGKISFDQQTNNLTNLKILGNSIQTGTPSTSTPATIESVGDKTENLIEYPYSGESKQNYNVNEDSSIDVNVNTGENTYSTFNLKENSYLEAGSYYFSSGNDEVILAFYYQKENGEDAWKTIDEGGKLVLNEDFDYIKMYLQINPNSSVHETIYPILKKDSKIETYEPYGKYKIPITVRSINLYKPTRISAGGIRTPADPVILENNVGTTINTTDAKENNFIITQSQIGNASHQENYSNGYFCFEIGNNTLLHKKNYILSFDCEIIDNLFENNNNNLIIAPNFDMDYSSVILAKNGRTHASFTYVWNNVNNDNFIEIRNMGKSLKIKNIMITDVGDSTEYTPYIDPFTQYIYLDEPLRKIGEYEDYIDLKEGKVYRYVEVIDDTGTLPLNESLRGLDSPIIEDVELPSIFSINPDLKIVADTIVKATIEKE